jgi:hypothetical protein
MTPTHHPALRFIFLPVSKSKAGMAPEQWMTRQKVVGKSNGAEIGQSSQFLVRRRFSSGLRSTGSSLVNNMNNLLSVTVV